MKEQGLTIVEILLVVSLMALLLSLASPAYNYFRTSTQLNENTAQLTQALRLARQRSLAGYHNSAHGVWLERNSGVDRYVIYQGSSYVTRDTANDREVWLINNLDLSFTDLTLTNDDVDLNFSSGTGLPSDFGTINVQFGGRNKSIIINSAGLIEMQ